jgi:TPR repeat protein
MYFRCEFKEGLFFSEIKKSGHAHILETAYAYFEEHNSSKGHDLLKELVDSKNSLALVLSSMFSKKEESFKSFSSRRFENLEVAAEAENSFALYSLGVLYDTGEYVEEDKCKAFMCFKKAAELGMTPAMHIYGIMLYYGSGGAEQDKERGLLMVKYAAADVPEAAEFLEFLNESMGLD